MRQPTSMTETVREGRGREGRRGIEKERKMERERKRERRKVRGEIEGRGGGGERERVCLLVPQIVVVQTPFEQPFGMRPSQGSVRVPI